MLIKLKNNNLEISKSNYKEKFYSETAIYYTIKKELQLRGLDIIKIGQRGIAKDGHLISNDFILTERRRKYLFWDTSYSIRKLNEDFNKNGEVKLELFLINSIEFPEELRQI